MLSKRSIRVEYSKQIIIASLALIAIFSFILYGYIKSYIYQELKDELLNEAESIAISNARYRVGTVIKAYSIGPFKSGDALIEVVSKKGVEPEIAYEMLDKSGRSYIRISYPYQLHNNSYITITKDISTIKKLLNDILKSILIINFVGFLLIQIYAYALSSILTKPILGLSKKLSKMDESRFEKLDTEKVPQEFVPLVGSLNSLFDRISNYLLYQKELFVGIAHELKTPLAVMKLKNEVALIKDRDVNGYKEAIKLNIQTIDRLNKMITQILEVGRQEGAQFEPPTELDIIEFLEKKAQDFKLLAKNEQKTLSYKLEPKELRLYIQPTLFNHIIQNFLQNALKFTPNGRSVFLSSSFKDEIFEVRVIDEGRGLDGNIDVYAPFKKSGDESGAGLGLFLAKSAADTLGVEISLENRTDAEGAIATIRAKLKRKNQKEAYKIVRVGKK